MRRLNILFYHSDPLNLWMGTSLADLREGEPPTGSERMEEAKLDPQAVVFISNDEEGEQ